MSFANRLSSRSLEGFSPKYLTYAVLASTERLESLFAKDKAHPGLWGSYLYSCMIYSALTGRSPVSLAAPDAIPAETVKLLQETAWAQHQETAAALKK